MPFSSGVYIIVVASTILLFAVGIYYHPSSQKPETTVIRQLCINRHMYDNHSVKKLSLWSTKFSWVLGRAAALNLWVANWLASSPSGSWESNKNSAMILRGSPSHYRPVLKHLIGV